MKLDAPGIYKIVNTVTGDFYIGSASNISIRKFAHFKKLREGTHANSHFQNAYCKYGEDVFRLEVVENCEKVKLVVREQYYIDTLRPSYNKVLIVTKGTRGMRLGPRSEETKEKISKSQRGVPKPNCTGNKAGEKITFEVAQQIREEYGKVQLKGVGRSHKEISMKELSLKYGLAASQIHDILHRKIYKYARNKES